MTQAFTATQTLLEGNLGSISLANLVQLIGLEQKSARLTLSRVEIGQSATMLFRRGELLDAEVNGMRGNDAVVRIVNWWNAGTFKLVALGPFEEPERTVSARMDFLLLESMRQLDEAGYVRELLPALTSAASFTQAALDAFRWDVADPAEWLPHEIRQLPRSFSMAQLLQICPRPESELAGLLKMLLATQAIRVHPPAESGQPAAAEAFSQAPGAPTEPPSSRYESFAQLLMEYVGFEQAYGLVDQTLYDLGFEDLDGLTMTQLLDICDRMSGSLSQHLDRKKQHEAARRLRARATSLL